MSVRRSDVAAVIWAVGGGLLFLAYWLWPTGITEKTLGSIVLLEALKALGSVFSGAAGASLMWAVLAASAQ